MLPHINIFRDMASASLKQIEFTRSHTQIVKGVAIVLMLLWHVTGWGAYDVPMSYWPMPYRWRPMWLVCAGIYTFMVGYGYAFSKKKDLAYAAKHIWRLLRTYWAVLLVFTLPVLAAVAGPEAITRPGIKGIAEILVGLRDDWNYYSWYVYFFIFAMAVMPFVGRLIDRWPVVGTLISIIVFYACNIAINHLGLLIANPNVGGIVAKCTHLMPTAIVGYAAAHCGLVTRLRLPRQWWVALAAAIAAIIAFVLFHALSHSEDYYIFNYLLCAPVIVVAIVVIFNLYEMPPLSRVLMSLGKASVWMWFLHCVFFLDDVRTVYQPIISWSGNVWVAVLCAILSTYAVARAMMWIESRLKAIFGR